MDDEYNARCIIGDAYGISADDVLPVLGHLIDQQEVTAEDIVSLVVDALQVRYTA